VSGRVPRVAFNQPLGCRAAGVKFGSGAHRITLGSDAHWNHTIGLADAFTTQAAPRNTKAPQTNFASNVIVAFRTFETGQFFSASPVS
jgi:hypothetical protein